MDIPLTRPSYQQVGQLASSILRRALGSDERKIAALGHSIAQLYEGDTRKCLNALHLMIPSLRVENPSPGLFPSFGAWMQESGSSQVQLEYGPEPASECGEASSR